MIALMLTRLAPSRPYVKPRPEINTFHSVAIDLDRQAQAGVQYLQRLIIDELQGGFSVEALAPKENCSHEQLLKLSMILIGEDPESGKPAERLVLSPIQFASVGQYLAQQIAHVAKHNTSRVWDISVEVIRPQLQALYNALTNNRTRILTWNELCRLPLPQR